MRKSLRTFYLDERGSFLTTEWAFVATILVLGAFSYLAVQQAASHGERHAAHRSLD